MFSYGEQILLADLMGFFVGMTGAYYTRSGGAVFLAVLPASPVVHGLHGHSGRALGGLLLHLGLMGMGTFAGVALDDCRVSQGHLTCEGGSKGFIGLIGGMFIASVLDATILTD